MGILEDNGHTKVTKIGFLEWFDSRGYPVNLPDDMDEPEFSFWLRDGGEGAPFIVHEDGKSWPGVSNPT